MNVHVIHVKALSYDNQALDTDGFMKIYSAEHTAAVAAAYIQTHIHAHKSQIEL